MKGKRNCARLVLAAFCLGATACGPAEKPDAFPILTPPAPPAPRIHGARVFGVRPGSPFLFQIAASGERPMQFEAVNLPSNLSLDPESGLITGQLADAGRHEVLLRARNARGTAERTLTIVVGDEIALTPPMGWNSWNAWGGTVTEEKVRAAAQALVRSGLRDHGWTYVNIDDGWQGVRGGPFNAIQPNAKFTDIGKLAADLHSLGLKLGIYSTPWRTSFYGQIGSSADTADGHYDWIERGQHNQFFKFRFPREPEMWLAKFSWLQPLTRWRRERWMEAITRKLRTFGQVSFVTQDVRQWSAWGVDYVKYDWVPVDRPHTAEMARALASAGRDIVLSVANNTPFSLAGEIAPLAQAWRTSGDVKDSWRDVVRSGFTRDRWARWQRPGHYNDADMLVLGTLGWGKEMRPTRLSSDEQYAHMSLWCLLGGPLLLGCDLEKLDPFTLGLLTNDEVLEVDQDALGKQATRVGGGWQTDIFAKVLADGSWAVGLFNRGTQPTTVRVTWSSLGLTGAPAVRDLWRQQDLGVFADFFESTVPGHGVVLLRVAPRPNDKS